MLGKTKETKRKKEKTDFHLKKSKYQKNDDDEEGCGPLQPRLSADDLIPYINELAKQEMKDWKEEDVLKVVEVLRARICIKVGGCSKKTLEIYHPWRDKWENYMGMHPEIRKLLDPWYVILLQDAELPNLDFMLDTCGEIINFAVVKQNRVYSFDTKHDAKFFSGFMYASYTNLVEPIVLSSDNYEEYY